MLDLFISGGPVMYPLLACSIIVMTVIIERIIFWIGMDKKRNKALVDEVLDLCRTGSWETIRVKTKGSKDYIIRILVSGILHRDFSMAKAMESAAAEEIKGMQKYMAVIDTMITVAPLLGIFGTVIGIILSFEMLGVGRNRTPSSCNSRNCTGPYYHGSRTRDCNSICLSVQLF